MQAEEGVEDEEPEEDEYDNDDYGTPIWESDNELYSEPSLLSSTSKNDDAPIDATVTGLLSFDEAARSPFVEMILEEMGGAFKEFVLGNAAALAKGEKAFTIEVYGERVSYLCRPYVEKSRQMLIERLHIVHAGSCSKHEKAAFHALMERYGLSELYGSLAATGVGIVAVSGRIRARSAL